MIGDRQAIPVIQKKAIASPMEVRWMVAGGGVAFFEDQEAQSLFEELVQDAKDRELAIGFMKGYKESNQKLRDSFLGKEGKRKQ